ncbi:MAG: hypothetical protein WCX46_04265 [Candidatus Paceibacterota bacterium]
MKECCKIAIINHLRNESLSRLQEVAKIDFNLNPEERNQLVAFLEGMKILIN